MCGAVSCSRNARSAAQIRACRSVREYILLGECDGSTCGDQWATWGVAPADAAEYGIDEDAPPPYAADGFERVCSAWVERRLVLSFVKRQRQ